jgi:hypothetical protein
LGFNGWDFDNNFCSIVLLDIKGGFMLQFLQFVLAFSISLGGYSESPKLNVPCVDYSLNMGFTLRDDKFKYGIERESGDEYHTLISSLDLVTSTPFQLLPFKTVWFIEGNLYDREKQDISLQNFSVGGYNSFKGFQYRIGGGVSYDNYKDGQPCIYSEIRYCKAKTKNTWLVIIDKLMFGSDYQFVVSGLFCRDRSEYHFTTLNSFHISKLVSFEIETDLLKTRKQDYKMGSLNLAFDL